MLTSLFRKSTPVNYTLVILLVVLCYFLYHVWHPSDTGIDGLLMKIGLLLVVVASVLVSNFIVKKNAISKDSAYTILFYLLFMLFFPHVLGNPNVLLANFFVILALRRLISLHSPKSTKEKIFDASLWICVAALYQFWCILYFVLVFLSILFHVSRDYRNWILPFFAALCTGSGFALYAFLFDPTLVSDFESKMAIDLSINYFTDNRQNLALAIYAAIALFYLFSLLISLGNRPQMLQSSFKKIVAWFVISAGIFAISPGKSNDLLLLTAAPLAFMATCHIEVMRDQVKQEITLALTILCSLFLFGAQL
jgi:hypothetical protein